VTVGTALHETRVPLRTWLLASFFLAQRAGGSGDGTQNTTAPLDDPGWANLGIRGGISAVYLGNRRVVTAAHVGIGSVTFRGVLYDAIPGHDGDGTIDWDGGAAPCGLGVEFAILMPTPAVRGASSALWYRPIKGGDP